jgi:transcriptional regulator GlxA family with amidase domain
MALALESALVEWLPAAASPDPLVEATVAVLRAGPHAFRPQRPVAALAGDLGVSERQLHRRCSAAVGYGPKTLERVLRFRRFLALASREPGAGLAWLAASAGYADQAHLTRECGRLGGAPPARLVARLVPAD